MDPGALREATDGVVTKTNVTLRDLGDGYGFGIPEVAHARVDILRKVAYGELDREDVEVTLTVQEDGTILADLDESEYGDLL